MDVFQRILDVLVAKDAHDMERISGSVVFHRSLPMAKRMECYLHQPLILQFACQAFSLLGKVVTMMVERLLRRREHSVSVDAWQGFKHGGQLWADVEYSRVAVLFWSDSHYFANGVSFVPCKAPCFA